MDWTARDTQGDTLFKYAEGWVPGFKLHPPVTHIPLNQLGFYLAGRRQGYCTNTAPLKKICLVLDPPMVTGQADSCNSNWWWCVIRIFEAVERNRYFHWQFCVISDPCV